MLITEMLSLALTDLLTATSLIFGGCCSNLIVLESLTRQAVSSIYLITLAQFVFVSLVGLCDQLEIVRLDSLSHPGSPSTLKLRTLKTTTRQRQNKLSTISSQLRGSFPLIGKHALRLRPRKVPFQRYMVMVFLFIIVSLFNNVALSYNVPMPVHIIFRSGGLLVSQIMGIVLLKRRYSLLQYTGVGLVTFGVVMSTFSSTSIPVASTQSKEGFSDHTIGIFLLSTALILSGLLGVYQEITYNRYGRNWRENLFYTHFYALPFFLAFRHSLIQDIILYSQSEFIPISSLFYTQDIREGSTSFITLRRLIMAFNFLQLPELWTKLFVNTLTQYACIVGVHKLSSMTTSLTLTLVLTVRKFVSLILSFVLFKNQFTTMHLLASMCVFAGSVTYAWASTRKSLTSLTKERKTQ